MTEQHPIVHPGDKVIYWSSETGMDDQYGTVERAEAMQGSTYAKIIPDAPPHTPKYLFYRAVWGFELVRGS